MTRLSIHLVISLVVHGFLFAFWLHWENQNHEWGGGRTGNAPGVGLIWVEIPGSTTVQNNQEVAEEQGLIVSRNDKASLFQREQKIEAKKASKKEGMGRQSSKGEEFSGKPGWGEGNSVTPAGGIGEGMDASHKSRLPDLLQLIRQKIMAAKNYPLLARKQGLQGRVKLVFEILPDGKIKSLALIESSGYRILDEEALATIKRAAPFPFLKDPIPLVLKFDLEE